MEALLEYICFSNGKAWVWTGRSVQIHRPDNVGGSRPEFLASLIYHNLVHILLLKARIEMISSSVGHAQEAR
jgi:hypothetical protein